MMKSNNLEKKLILGFPDTFWVLTFSTFIDRLGGFLLFPFFAIYITKRFEVGMTQVGFLFMALSIGGMLGSLLGGALADKIGRKKIALFGLVMSGLGSVLMGLANSFPVFILISVVLGTLGNMGRPARQAMVADILPEEKRSQGFGVLRVAVNIAATVGPITGGILAHNFMILFIADAISSLVTAVIVLLVIPETKPESKEETTPKTTIESLRGYLEVLKDGLFMAFLGISAIMTLVYMQLYSTLSVFLNTYYGVTEAQMGWILSVNAFMVVTLQIAITKITSKLPPLIMMAFGTVFYGIGFGLYGFVDTIPMFVVAIAILTIGEMIALPVGQALVAGFAPENKRGRYSAVYGFSWAVPNMFGIILAGLVMDNLNPNWVWYGCGIISAVAITGFMLVHKTGKSRLEKPSDS